MRLIILCLLIPYACISQEVMTAEQFFKLGLSRYIEQEQSQGEEVNFPWIDKYEFRTETDDFAIGQQEYTIRLSPSTAKIRKAQKALYEEMRNAPDFDGQEVHCDYVSTLYDDWKKLFIISEKKIILDELSIVLNDKQTIYEKMVGTYDFDPRKLVKLHTEKSDMEISQNKLKLEWEFLLSKYSMEGLDIDFDDFVTIESISQSLADKDPSSYSSVMIDDETAYKQRLITKEMELESADKKRLIDFLQVKYSGPHADPFNERLSIGLGFQLDNSGSKKLKMLELQLEKDELIEKAEKDNREQLTKSSAQESELQHDIQSYIYLKDIIKKEREYLGTLSDKITDNEDVSPLFLLDIEKRHYSLTLKAIDKKEKLLTDFLKYVKQTGEMCTTEFTNCLSQ